MGEEASSWNEPGKPKELLRFLRPLVFSPLLPVLPPTELSNFRPQNKMIYNNIARGLVLALNFALLMHYALKFSQGMRPQKESEQ